MASCEAVSNPIAAIPSRRYRGATRRLLSAVLIGVAVAGVTDLAAQAQAAPPARAATSTPSFKNTAQTLIARGAWPELLLLGRQWTTAAPKDAEAWLALGIANGNLGNPDAAVIELRNATQLVPNLYLAWLNLGAIDLRRSQFQPALLTYQHVLQSQPRNGAALYGAGLAEVGLLNHVAAQAYFRQAVAAAPGSAPAWRSLGVEERVLKHQLAAADALTRAATLAPKDVTGWILLGQVDYEAGHYDQASRIFDRIQPLNAYEADNYAELFLNPTIDRLHRPDLGNQAMPATLKARLLEALADGGDLAALAVLNEAAARNEPAAAYAMGIYERDVTQDDTAAARWFHLAVARGSISAAVALATPNLAGTGVADESGAYDAFMQDASVGFGAKASVLALAYAKGNGGFPRDTQLAAFWRARGNSGPVATSDIDELSESVFDTNLGRSAVPILSSISYIGAKSGAAATPDLQGAVALMTQQGIAGLDDQHLASVAKLRAALALGGDRAACATIWTGADSTAFAAAVKALPVAQQSVWADLVKATAEAAQSNRPANPPSQAAIDAATARLTRTLSRSDAAAIVIAQDNAVAADPVDACYAARVFYRALLRLDTADTALLMRTSVRH